MERKPIPYDPPAPAFDTCPTCSAVIAHRVWVHGTKEAPAIWKPLDHAVNPVSGTPHAQTCTLIPCTPVQ